jgi:hypothetical protein
MDFLSGDAGKGHDGQGGDTDDCFHYEDDDFADQI